MTVSGVTGIIKGITHKLMAMNGYETEGVTSSLIMSHLINTKLHNHWNVSNDVINKIHADNTEQC